VAERTLPPPSKLPQSKLPPSKPASTRSRIAHLYRRAGFGARPEELDAAVAVGYQATVDRLLDLTAPDPGVAAMADPTFTDIFGDFMTVRRHHRFEANRMTLWWLNRMIAATNPLPEKLTLFWHDHFATSLQKVKAPELMFRQNQLFRAMGAGRFEPLAQAVAKDAAMMVWLDSNSNRRESPNENFARELFELFTVGVGNYAESDIKAAARAFTGWRVSPRTQQFAFAPRLHDGDSKVLFGATRSFGGEDVVHLLATRPACVRFITAKVWSHFGRPAAAPDDRLLAELAEVFAPELDMRALLRAIFLHPEFNSPATRTGLVKQPIEYVAGALRALGQRAEGTDLLRALRLLGQEPFVPPSVGGWPANGYWLSTASSLGRVQFAEAAARDADLTPVSSVSPKARPAAAAHLLSVEGWGPTTTNALQQVADEPRSLLTLALVAPEYVLA
jgi:uncharacterized protein (DUF1800 family)